MKTAKFLVLPLAFLLLAGISVQVKTDLQNEKKAIMAVMEEETNAYYASDFDRWNATYLRDSTEFTMGASNGGFGLFKGEKARIADMKEAILMKKEPVKEVKTPMEIKVYNGTAWIVFNNESYDNKGNVANNQIVTCFLEKDKGSWKIVYRNVVGATSYYQPDNFILGSINYAKSLGKTAEDVGSFTGEMFKTRWNKDLGYNGFASGTISNWGSVVPSDAVKILEQDDNHVIFTVNKFIPALKSTGQLYNVTYDDYLTFYRKVFEKFADHMGSTYKQENTKDGVLITIKKK